MRIKKPFLFNTNELKIPNFEIRNLWGHLVCELWPKTNFKRSQQGEKRDWWIPTDTFPLCCGSPFSILYCDDDRWENRLERICFHKKLSTRIKVCICTDSKEKQGEKALYSLSESQETNSGRGLLPKLLDYLDLIAKLSLKSFLFQLFINDTAIIISSPSFRIKICFNEF